MTHFKPIVFFAISAQHFIPTGGIGSFFRGFQRMATEIDWDVVCVLDKKPIGQGRHMMEAHANVQFVWPETPQSYAKHGTRFDPETVNQFKVANFIESLSKAVQTQKPDLVLINTLEASLAQQQLMQAGVMENPVRTIFYTHHENFVVPDGKRSKVFSIAYNETLLKQANTPGIEIATQSQFNVERMNQIGFPFAHDPLVLPMPLPDLQLLAPFHGAKDGVLFIGRHEPRKNPKLFAKSVAEAGLSVKVLTNKRGVAKFEKTLTDAGVTNFDIQCELTGQAKADFIHSARIAFHPAGLESYGFSAMETLAAGLPTLLIEEFEWWRAFEQQGVLTSPRKDVVAKLQSTYGTAQTTDSQRWLQAERETKSKWADLI
jgi:glycosyltransferase involved in cell wall biosynthesis